MALLYAERWSGTAITDQLNYIFSDPIKAGHVLHVHSCFAHAPQRALGAIIHLGVRNGGVDILV
ncbi:unnamed protein product, partial [marine sediment metagenome]